VTFAVGSMLSGQQHFGSDATSTTACLTEPQLPTGARRHQLPQPAAGAKAAEHCTFFTTMPPSTAAKPSKTVSGTGAAPSIAATAL
jgi:hypothetical protein